MKTMLVMLRLAWLLFVVAAMGCGPTQPDPFQQAVLTSLAKAQAVEVLEGLPHPRWEPESLKAELKSAKTIELHGYPFYDAPQSLTAAQRGEFVALLGQSGVLTLTPPGMAKACGGFHPDYALRWSEGERRYAVLFCFGCSEVQLFSAGSEQTYDVSPKARFEDILKPFQKLRPEFKPRS